MSNCIVLQCMSSATTATGTPRTDEEKDKLVRQLQKDIDRDYLLKVEQISRQDSFEISLRKKTGKQIPDPIDPVKYPPSEVYCGWESKTFSRHSLTPSQYITIEKLKMRFTTETDPSKVPDHFGRLYQWLAYFYLDMEYDDFIRCNWDELKSILDGCNFRTVYSLHRTEGMMSG